MVVAFRCSGSFTWNSYDRINSSGSNSYGERPFYPGKEKGMVDLLLLGAGFALFCLFIAYERLCHRL